MVVIKILLRVEPVRTAKFALKKNSVIEALPEPQFDFKPR